MQDYYWCVFEISKSASSFECKDPCSILFFLINMLARGLRKVVPRRPCSSPPIMDLTALFYQMLVMQRQNQERMDRQERIRKQEEQARKQQEKMIHLLNPLLDRKHKLRNQRQLRKWEDFRANQVQNYFWDNSYPSRVSGGTVWKLDLILLWIGGVKGWRGGRLVWLADDGLIDPTI